MEIAINDYEPEDSIIDTQWTPLVLVKRLLKSHHICIGLVTVGFEIYFLILNTPRTTKSISVSLRGESR